MEFSYSFILIIVVVLPAHGSVMKFNYNVKNENSPMNIEEQHFYSDNYLNKNSHIRVRRQNGYNYEKPAIPFDLPGPKESSSSSGSSGYPESGKASAPASAPSQPDGLYSEPKINEGPTSNDAFSNGGYEDTAPAPNNDEPAPQSDDGYPSKSEDSGSNTYDYSAPDTPVTEEKGYSDSQGDQKQYDYPKPETSTPGKPYLPPKLDSSVQTPAGSPNVPTNSYVGPSPNTGPTLEKPNTPVNKYVPPVLKPQDVGSKYVPPSKTPAPRPPPPPPSPPKTPTTDYGAPPARPKPPSNKYVPPQQPNKPVNKYVPPTSNQKPTPRPFAPVSTPASTYLPPYQ